MEIIPLNLPNLQTIFLIVDEKSDRVIAPYIKNYKIWEPAETIVMLNVVKPGYRVIDLGANIGYYTLMFAQLVGAKGQVFAFEPEPNNHRVLMANLLINNAGNVVCEAKAASNRSGYQTLYLSDFNLGDHRLFASGDRAGAQVETIILDEYFKNQPLDFVKMDTQGSEPYILEGMSEIIAKNRTTLGCLMEFCPGLLEKSGFGLGNFLAQLQGLNGIFYWIDATNNQAQLTRLDNGIAALEDIARQMLASNYEDASRDILVFFSPEAERRHLPLPT